MKKLILTYSFLLIASSLFAQDITGQWNGVLNVMGSQLELVFHIEETDNGYSATFDSPDQGAMGIPFSSASFSDDTLRLAASNISATYKGVLKADSLIGTWSQGGQSFPLNMSRNEVKKEEPKRPQEPEKPYPYYEEEVTFKNEKDSLTLAGTLTIPEKTGSYPAVILISGSGAQNRNEEILGHKPFLVLADHLTRNGIAVLRYDDRGTAESTGDHSTATSKDFAQDVISAIEYLQSREEIDSDNIGLVGHSEGGLIAPMVANDTDDVAFIVMLAGPGVPGKEISLMQARTLQEC
ncbi:MAG: alpha/beta fold hydrolase [Balneolaceae bacterium]|nr:alpha/beta fold hydrolase [Balneolaceae bacterium]